MKREFLCQKKILYICYLAFLVSAFLSLFSTSDPVSALSFKNTGNSLASQYSSITINSTDYYISTIENNRRSMNVLMNTTSHISKIFYNWNTFPGPLNGPGIFRTSFSFYVIPSNGNTFSDYPLIVRSLPSASNGSSMSIIDSSCESGPYDAFVYTYSLTCEVVWSWDSTLSGIRNFSLYMDIEVANTSDTYTLYTFMSPVSWTQFDFSSLSAEDKDWLTNNMPAIIEQAQQAHDQDVKTEVETETTTSETTVNTSSSGAETQGQTLLQAFSSFVSALQNVSAANTCNFDLDFSGIHSGLRAVVDVCTVSVPTELTFIGTLLLIVFIVPLSIATVRKMINLFRSFQT